MLLILGVLSAAAAIAVTVRWSLNRVDGLGRSHPFPLVTAALLCDLAVVLIFPTFTRHYEEGRLGKVASVLVGQHATVHCETIGQTLTDVTGDLGFVKFGADGVPEHHTTIMRGPCADLRRYYDGDQAHPTSGEIVAVHVLTHESMHMRGQRDESLAECEAMQRDAETAQLLGATPGEGLALARAYWMQVYPDMPDNYRTEDCKAGGGLDEHLPDPPWATGSYVAVKLPPAG
ncbi:MAG TPA: hypothetical protein VHC43_10420 [Mycobacteriales bacterium]|nr:hypothetical protein [Mycobacteriales bacterium]